MSEGQYKKALGIVEPKENAPTKAEATNQTPGGPNLSFQITTQGKSERAPLIPESVPDALRNLQGWLLWKFEHPEGATKPRKVPYYSNGGRRQGVQGRAEDRQQLTTFEQAKAAATRRGFDGVGLALMPEFGIVALDFDNCMADGGVHPDVEKLVAGTYAEYSPSGKGVRAFMVGQLGNNKSNNSNTWGFETFSTKGFVTVTGKRLDITDLLGTENTIANVNSELKKLCDIRFGERMTNDVEVHHGDPLMDHEPRVGLTVDQIREALDVLPKDLTYDEWLGVGMAVHHETQGEGFELWDEWSQQSAKYSSREYGLARWESFGRGGHRPVTARSLIKLANSHGANIQTDVAGLAEFDAVADKPAEDLGTAQRFQVQPLGQFAKGTLPTWIIKSVLPKAELAVVFGESGSGKSFLVMDMALAISRGMDWCGHRVKQGRVVYIAAEGAGGARTRANAYAQHHELLLDELPFGVINAAPNFLQKTDAVDVAKAIVASGPCDVVIVDTFAQTTPGANENSAEDIGKALAHCKGIHRATGALVILVHHSGKDASKGARGWSGIKAAADAEIEVTRLADARLARVSKMKDGEDGSVFPFKLTTVPVGVDEDGDVISSCVVEYTNLPPPPIKQPQGKVQKAVWNVVLELAENGVAEIEAVVAEVIRASIEDGKPTMRRDNITRTITRLAEDAFFCIEGSALVLPHSSKFPQKEIEE